MPQVPYQPIPTVQPNQPLEYQRIQATPEAFGSQVAGATRQAGAMGERTADEMFVAAQQFQAKQDTANVDDVYSNKFSPAFREMYHKYYSLQGKDALDQMPTFIEGMQKIQQETSQSLPNDRQRHLFNSMSRKRVEMELDGMARYADTQNKVWQEETFKSTLTNLATDAADKHNDEQAFGRTLGIASFNIEKYAIDHGKSSEWIKAQSQQFGSDAAVSRVERMITDNPESADAWYKANAGMIDPKHRPLLEHQLKAAIMPYQVDRKVNDAMGPDADGVIQRAISGNAPFPAQGSEKNGITYVSAPDEATAQVIAADMTSKGKKFNIEVGNESPTHPRDIAAMEGYWIGKATEGVTDPIERDAIVNKVKSRVSTLKQIQTGIQNQAHSALTDLMMQNNYNDVRELTSTPQGRQAWALISPESQRGFVAWSDQNQRKAEGKPSKINAALELDLGQRIHLPPNDPRAITNPNQLVPYIAQGLTLDGKRSLEKELDQRLTPDGRRIADVRNDALKALLPRFDSSTMTFHDEKGKEDFLKFSEYARAKEAKLAAAGKDPYTIYLPTSPDYIGKDVPTFQRTLQEKVQNRIDSMGAGREASGAITTPSTQVRYGNHIFPNQASLDAYKAAGGK